MSANNGMPLGGTEQSSLVTVVVDGTNFGVFDTYAGGDALAKSVKHRPGGMGSERSYVTLASYSDMKVSRVLEIDRDWDMAAFLTVFAGRVPGSVTVQPLDGDGNAFGNSHTFSGVFLGVSGIKGDSNSEAVQMVDLDFSIETVS